MCYVYSFRPQLQTAARACQVNEEKQKQEPGGAYLVPVEFMHNEGQWCIASVLFLLL